MQIGSGRIRHLCLCLFEEIGQRQFHDLVERCVCLAGVLDALEDTRHFVVPGSEELLMRVVFRQRETAASRRDSRRGWTEPGRHKPTFFLSLFVALRTTRTTRDTGVHRIRFVGDVRRCKQGQIAKRLARDVLQRQSNQFLPFHRRPDDLTDRRRENQHPGFIS